MSDSPSKSPALPAEDAPVADAASSAASGAPSADEAARAAEPDAAQPGLPEDEERPRSLAPPHMRLFGMMLDYLLAVALSKLVEQVFLGGEWDLHMATPGTERPWLIPLLGVGLLMLRDLPWGASPGRWFAGLTVRDAAAPDRVPAAARLVLRNLTLLLLPLEVVWVFVDPYYRRLGDRWMGTVVVVHPAPTSPTRRLMVLGIVFLASILLSFLIAHWSLRRSAAFHVAYSAITEDAALQAQWGAPLEPGSSPELSLARDGRSARMLFAVEGPTGQGRAEVRLIRPEGAPTWLVDAVEKAPDPTGPGGPQ